MFSRRAKKPPSQSTLTCRFTRSCKRLRSKPRDLTIWSFLMATAHSAGFMVLAVLLGMSAGMALGHPASLPHLPLSTLGEPVTTALAVVVHTGGYLLVIGVYWKLGLALLRTA